MIPLLEIEGLAVDYAGAPALSGIDLDLAAGEAVAVLGPNGAGKSSLLRAIIGLAPARAAALRLAGTDLLPLPPHRRARHGIGYVPEGRRVFPGMTVRENLDVAALAPAPARARALDRVLGLFPVLAERSRDMAWRLSGGQQQMLAIGRALMPFPRLLLMDEPSLGLAPVVAAELFATLAQLVDRSEVAILLVEQNVGDAFALCHRAIHLDRGRIVAAGPGAVTAPSYGQVD